MKIRYLGPRTEVNVAPFGKHQLNDVKNYPDDFAKELMETSSRQRFEVVDGGPDEATADEILEAVEKVIKAGDVTSGGKPKVEAIEAILNKKVSAQDRDVAYQKLMERGK